MATRKTKSKPRRKIPVNLKCFFCENKKEPYFLAGSDELSRFLTERGKILNSDYSGVCNKHQKRLATAIKRARHLALLPFKGAI